MWFDVCPGVCTPVIVQPGPAAASSPSAMRTSGSKARSTASSIFTASGSSVSAGGCGPKPNVGAPVSSFSHAASGEWSLWQWVTQIAVTRSPASAAARASRWASSSGPGSTTATSPSPTM